SNSGEAAPAGTPSATAPAAPAAPAAPPAKAATPAAPALAPAAPAPTAPASETAPAGHDFIAQARALFRVAACAGVPPPPGLDAATIDKNCTQIRAIQDAYKTRWLAKAQAFFVQHVPATAPKKVVYPFAGGDLSTALTVFPDADEITTMSLEPAGDPRDLEMVKGRELEAALSKVRYELNFLYRVNFSNTINMIDAMRGGRLPTQLIFGLSAVKIHGYEVVGLRYFRLNEDGGIHYLDDDDVKKAPDAKATPEKRNRIFANIELQFRKPGGRVQVYRHIQTN